MGQIAFPRREADDEVRSGEMKSRAGNSKAGCGMRQGADPKGARGTKSALIPKGETKGEKEGNEYQLTSVSDLRLPCSDAHHRG